MTPDDIAAAKRAAQSLTRQEDDPDDAKAVLIARAFLALLVERDAAQKAARETTWTTSEPDFSARKGGRHE